MTKKSKAEQVEKKVQDTAPAAQQAEQPGVYYLI